MRIKQKRIVCENLPEAPAEPLFPTNGSGRADIILNLRKQIQDEKDAKEREDVNAAWGVNQNYIKNLKNEVRRSESKQMASQRLTSKDKCKADPGVQFLRDAASHQGQNPHGMMMAGAQHHPRPSTSRGQSGQEVGTGAQPQPSTSSGLRDRKLVTRSQRQPQPSPSRGGSEGPSKVSAAVSGTLTVKEEIIKIYAVEAIPNYTHWTFLPNNMLGKDNPKLTSMPYLGDVPDEEREKFADEVLKKYEKTELTDLLVQKPTIPDDVFFELVNKLIQMENENSPPEAVAEESRPTCIVLSERLAQDLSYIFPELGMPAQICKRFQDLAAKVPINEQHSDKEQLGSYRNKFCNRCNRYDCGRHTSEDILRPKTGLLEPANSNLRFEYKCTSPACRRLFNNFPSVDLNGIERNWDERELGMFTIYRHMTNNPCWISSLIPTKSCRQVKKLMEELEDRFPLVPQPQLPAPPLQENEERVVKRARRRRTKQIQKQKISTFIRKSSLQHGVEVITKNSTRYIPCDHEGECTIANNCSCKQRGTPCDKFCRCCPTGCKARFPPCKCHAEKSCRTSSCPCVSANRECDPERCKCCTRPKVTPDKPTPKTPSCCNLNLTYRKNKHVLLGESTVSGWGIFAKKDIEKWDFITEFTGEIISHLEAERRALLYDMKGHTFLFDLNSEFVLDATFMGNIARFINSSTKPNCICKQMLVNGDHRLAIYAERFIEAGEELFYDYDHVLKRHEEMRQQRSEEC